MQYPSIPEYMRAIEDAKDNLDRLKHLQPVLDDHGELYRSSGAFAVVFKMEDPQTGKCYALKCFTEEQAGRAEAYQKIADELEMVDSSYITSVKYLEKELFVDSNCEEEEFPVLLMDWKEGVTMEQYIAAHYTDGYDMSMLCYRFCKLAAWLRSQSFAHGDIKPDNIIVSSNGALTLVDYDGMFVPTMKGEMSPTIGTKNFSHLQRTVNDFDETIDDFALSVIALSLKAISLRPSLLNEYGASDRILFSTTDFLDLSTSKVITAIQYLMEAPELNTLYSLFLLAHAKKNLSFVSFRLFNISKPIYIEAVLTTEVTEKDYTNAVSDEFGVKYSKDGLKLLRAPSRIKGSYAINKGTKVICDSAFKTFCEALEGLTSIVIPKSVVSIGNEAFSGRRSLTSIIIPNGVTSIGWGAFDGCSDLTSIEIPKSVTLIGNSSFSLHELYKNLLTPSTIKTMNGNPFVKWNGLLINLSSNFIYEEDVLYDRRKEKLISFRSRADKFVIPYGVTSIEDNAFINCGSLKSIVIPKSVKSIGNCTFRGCSGLKSIVIPNGVTSIGSCAFYYCSNLTSIVIPESVTSIGRAAFDECKLSAESENNIIKRFGTAPFIDLPF